MTKLLVINSAATGAASVSNQLTGALVQRVRAIRPNIQVTVRDVGAEPLPHLVTETVGALRRSEPETDAERATRALSDRLIAELKETDILVIGAPMYNFGVSSTLKAWFDHVLRAGATFRYTATGPEGLVTGKRAIVIETRGGFYSEGPTARLDAQEPHLRAMLGMMGVTDITFVRAERLGIDPAVRAEAIAAATAALGELAETGLALAA